MVGSTKATGVKIRCMERECLLGLLVKCMKDSIMKIRSMGLVNLRSQMDHTMRGIGYLGSVMGVEFLCRLMGQGKRVNGVRINLLSDLNCFYII
jgi:hypothetical protein